MSSVLIEVVMDAKQLADSGFDGRDEIEEPLAEALETSGLGEVSGGGGGSGVSMIDVEVFKEESVDAVLELLKKELARLKAPAGTRLLRRGSQPAEYKLP